MLIASSIFESQVHVSGPGVALLVAFAASQLHELHMQLIEDIPIQRVHCVHQLVGVCTEVKVFYEASREFTEEEVVGLIDGPQAPVCVIVGAGAGTEGPQRPERRGLPVVVVVGEASEAWHAARVIVLQPLEQLAQFLLPFLFPQQPHLVLLLQSLPERVQAGAFVLEAAFVLGVVTEFMAVTFFWPLLLQVTSDLSQVLNFVLQGFNLMVDVQLVVFPSLQGLVQV